MVMVHLCRDAAFSVRLSHDAFFYGVGLAVIPCRSRWTFCKADVREARECQIDIETNKLAGARFSFPEVINLLDNVGIKIE